MFLQERLQARKEALERQREAARRAAGTQNPAQKAAMPGDSLAKSGARLLAAGAATAKPVETAASVRLKQAMEVRLARLRVCGSCCRRMLTQRRILLLLLHRRGDKQAMLPRFLRLRSSINFTSRAELALLHTGG